MKCEIIKIIGSNNKYLPLGGEYRGELIGNKLIVGQLIDLREDVEELMNIKIPKTKKEQFLKVVF